MTPDRWDLLKSWFAALIESSPAQRAELLAAYRQQDSELCDQVERLLTNYQSAGSFLESSLFSAISGAEDDTPLFRDGDVVCSRFTIHRFLGRGGMGEVYEASDSVIGVKVALKTIRRVVSGDGRFSIRFRREVQLAREVTHPNVCRIHDLFYHRSAADDHEDGREIPILSMELLAGETLSERLRRTAPLPESEAVKIAYQVLDGLAAAHRAHVIHQDLKPANIFLTQASEASIRVVIADFGLALGAASEDLGVAPLRSALRGGTPAYMAPEQLRGLPSSYAADVYAVGLICYELLTGSSPWGAQPTLELTLRRLQAPWLPPLDGVGPHWRPILQKCLAPDPGGRFQNADAVLAAIRGVDHRASAASASSRRRWLLGSGGILVSAIAVARFGWPPRLFRREPLAAGSMIVLTPIKSPPEVEGTTELMRSQLLQSPHFGLTEDARVQDVLKQMGQTPDALAGERTAREVALRAGAQGVLFGSVTKQEGRYRLQIRIEVVGQSPLVAASSSQQEFPATDQEDLLTAVHRASIWVRSQVGEAARDVAAQDRVPEDTSTSSWPALQLYSRAIRTSGSGHLPDAILLLREAVQLDPKFATAQARLADFLISQHDYKEGYAAWQRALALSEQRQLTSREHFRLQGQYYEDTGDLAAAERTFRAFALHYPNDSVPVFFLASNLADLGREAEAAEKFREMIRRWPQNFVPYVHLATLYLCRSERAAALPLVKAIRGLGQENWAVWLESFDLFLQKKIREALVRVDVFRSGPDPAWASRCASIQASWLAELDEWKGAVQRAEQGAEADAKYGLREAEADKHLLLASLLLRAGHREHAVAAGEAALSIADDGSRIMRAGSVMARSGDIARARHLLAALDGHPDIPKTRLYRARLGGEIALAAGDYRRAVGLFRQASELSPKREHPTYLARAYEQQGNVEAALKLFRRIVSRPGNLWRGLETEFPGMWHDAEVACRRSTPAAASSSTKSLSVPNDTRITAKSLI